MSLQIKKIISQIFLKELLIPNNIILTVTNVKLTSDLRMAKIYFSIFNQENSYNVDDTLKFLKSEKNSIRFKLGKYLQSKYVPDINFFYDNELYIYDKINKILKKDDK